jgi:hypothetical protein
VLAAGLGLTAPMWVAVALSAAGLVIFVSALGLERRASAPGRRPIAVRGRPVDVSPGS